MLDGIALDLSYARLDHAIFSYARLDYARFHMLDWILELESKNSNSRLSSEQKVDKNVNRKRASNQKTINCYGYFLYLSALRKKSIVSQCP